MITEEERKRIDRIERLKKRTNEGEEFDPANAENVFELLYFSRGTFHGHYPNSPAMPQAAEKKHFKMNPSAREMWQKLKNSLSLDLTDECFMKNQLLLQMCAADCHPFTDSKWAYIFKPDEWMTNEENVQRKEYFTRFICKEEFKFDPHQDLQCTIPLGDFLSEQSNVQQSDDVCSLLYLERPTAVSNAVSSSAKSPAMPQEYFPSEQNEGETTNLLDN